MAAFGRLADIEMPPRMPTIRQPKARVGTPFRANLLVGTLVRIALAAIPAGLIIAAFYGAIAVLLFPTLGALF
jgi:hypothetical protein